MQHRVDARGLSCPQPVVLTQKALSGMTWGDIEVLVDSVVARENVVRFAKSRGCAVEVSQSGDDAYTIKISHAERG